MKFFKNKIKLYKFVLLIRYFIKDEQRYPKKNHH